MITFFYMFIGLLVLAVLLMALMPEMDRDFRRYIKHLVACYDGKPIGQMSKEEKRELAVKWTEEYEEKK